MINQSTISFLIHWLPTILFLTALGISLLFGAIRGFRKSLILAIQAGILFLVLLIVYLNIASAAKTDTALFSLVEQCVGKGKIQSLLNVSEDCNSFEMVFVEFIPKQLPENEGLALVLVDNGAYLATLAQMAVRIVVAFVFSILYLIGVFLLYIIYLIFYPQRRHERKLKNEYEQGLREQEIKEKRKAKKEAKRKAKEETQYELLEDDLEDSTEDTSLASKMMEDDLEGEIYYNENGEVIYDDATPFNFDHFDNQIDGDLMEEEIEHEEKNKVEKEEVSTPKQRPPFEYKKRRLFGMLIGGVRGLISGLIFLSFLGGFFFVIAGGPGDDVTPETVDFEDDNLNLAYGAYADIETYGSVGIFKVLNAFKGTDNAPLYLFAADLVFQGGLKDEKQGIDENIYLRKELSCYTKFARDTFNLLMKHGQKEIRDAVIKSKNGEYGEGESMMDDILAVMLKEEFQKEFTPLIDTFEESTYFINLSYSLINSFINHIDKMGLDDIGSETLSLIQLVFKQGYLADEIPYEKYIKDNNLDNTLQNDYISPKLIINKDNAKIGVNILFGILSANNNNKEDGTKRVLDIIENVIPYFTEFTFFKEENSKNVSNVLARVYQFVQNTYLKKISTDKLQALRTEEVENPYTNEKYKDVNWVDEIKDLVLAVKDIIVLYNHAYKKDAPIIDNIFNIFNTENETYEEDKVLFDSVKDTLCNSFLLGDVLAGEFGSDFLKSMLKDQLPNLEVPDVNFSNVKQDGVVVEGEFYHLLNALEAFATNQKNKELINSFSNGMSGDMEQVLSLVENLCDSLSEKNSKNQSVLDIILESKLFTAIISEFILSTKDNPNFALYVDDSILELKDGVRTRIIVKEELQSFFGSGKELASILKDLTGEKDISNILSHVLCENVYNMLDSKLIEGTMSNYIATNVSGEFVILPRELKDKSGYISKDGNTSEVKHIIALYEVEDLDISILTKTYTQESEQKNSIVSMLKNLNQDDYDKMFESKILYYSMSNYITSKNAGFLGDADLIIPDITKENLTNEDINIVIKKNELSDFFIKSSLILPSDMSNVDLGVLVNSIVDNSLVCENLILSATMTNMMVNVDSVKNSINGVIIISSEFNEAGNKDDLHSYTKSNIWYLEHPKLMKSIKALLGDIKDESDNRITITNPNIGNYVYDSFKSLNDDYDNTTRLDVVYESSIMQATITKRIDDMDFLNDNKKLACKNLGIYKKEELASLVDLINLFELDLKNTNVLSTAMTSSTILKLLDNYVDKNLVVHDYSNLTHQYENKITGLILTEGIEKQTSIPSDAYVDGELYITLLEAESLISSISSDKLNLDLNNFSFNGENISINTLKKCVYKYENGAFVLDSNDNPILISKILLQNLSEQVVTYDYLDIPISDYDTTYNRVKPEAAYYFLTAVESLDSNFKLKQAISEVELPDPCDDAKMAPIRKSKIFRASIARNLLIKVNDVNISLLIETNLLDVEDNFDSSKQVGVLDANETVNLFGAIRILNQNGTLSNLNIKLQDLRNLSPNDRLEIYKSHIVGNRVSDLILGIPLPLDYTTITGDTPSTVQAINIQTLDIVNDYELLSDTEKENYVNSLP